jgi:hypothetical protein
LARRRSFTSRSRSLTRWVSVVVMPSRTPASTSALDPFGQGLRHTANLGGNGLDGGPQRRVLPAVLLHYPRRPLTHLE